MNDKELVMVGRDELRTACEHMEDALAYFRKAGDEDSVNAIAGMVDNLIRLREEIAMRSV